MYNDIPNLSYAAAVFTETLRLYPSIGQLPSAIHENPSEFVLVGQILFIPKVATEDTVLKTVNKKGEPVVVPISKGSMVYTFPLAVHTNRGWGA
jgi:hypothetical protein